MEHTCEIKENNPIIATEDNEDKALVGEVDRISHLPEPLVHKIMSLLPTRYAIRTSVLSRKWEFMWCTFPEITLDEVNLRHRAISVMGPMKFLECRNKFITCLKKTLSKRGVLNLDKLRISTILDGTDAVYEVVNCFIDAAMKGGLKELDLQFPNKLHQIIVEERGCESCYKLPEVVFSFGSCLLLLRVIGCNFVEFKNLNVSFPSLKILSIENTHIGDQFLERIICGCPALESLSLRSCHGLKSARVSHSKVMHFVFGSFGEILDLRISLPSLLSFKHVGKYSMNESGDLEASTFFPSTEVCRFLYLNTLTLSCVSIESETLNLILTNLFNLKTLKIKMCCSSGRVRVYGDNLTTLVIRDCEFQEQVEIQARELRKFKFIDNEKGFNFEMMQFQFLKTISIAGNNEIIGEDLELIVSCSPVLLTMILKSCNKVEHLAIYSKSLEHMEIEKCFNLKEIRLLAPALLVFKYKGPVSRISQLCMSDKLTAELDLEEPHQDRSKSTYLELVKMWEFLQHFSCFVKSMTLGCECAEFAITPKGLHVSPPLDYLNFFKVKTWLREINLVDFLQGVLAICNCFNTLCIDTRLHSMQMEELTNEEMLERLKYPEMHECVKEHLTEVRMKNFVGNDDELKLIEFLLGKASRLKTLSISMDIASAPSRRPEFIELVNNLPSASQNVEILCS